MNPCLYPALFREIVQNTAWLNEKKQCWSTNVLQSFRERRFVCTGKYLVNSRLFVGEGDNPFFYLTDGRHSVVSTAHRDFPECHGELYPENTVVVVLAYELVIALGWPDVNKSDQPQLSLVLKNVGYGHGEQLHLGKLRPISEEANVRSLLRRFQALWRSTNPVCQTVISNEPSAPTASATSLHKPQTPAQLNLPCTMAQQSENERGDQIGTGHTPNENEVAGPSAESLHAVFPSELQRWQALEAAGGIPKYGSTPANTSAAQVNLLEDDVAWDPPLPGKQHPQRYIPSKDLQILQDYANHPEKFVARLETAVSQDISQETHAEVAASGSGVQSTSDDIVAYALARRENPQLSPDATETPKSQWLASQVQTSKTAPQTSDEVTEALGKPDALGSSGGCNDDAEDSDRESLPPDTPVARRSSHQTHECDTAKDTQSSRPTWTAVQQTAPAKDIQLFNGQALTHASQAIANEQPNTLSSSSRDVYHVNVSASLGDATKTPSGSGVSSLDHSITQHSMPPVGTESDEESDIEMAVPRGTNDIPSSSLSQDVAKDSRKSLVQVKQTPTPIKKDKDLQVPGSLSTGSSARLVRLDDQTRVHAATSANLLTHDESQGDVTVPLLPVGTAHEGVVSTIEQNLTSKNAGLATGGKRRLSKQDPTDTSNKRVKMYKTVTTSPDFSQDTLKLATTTPDVVRLRKEHFGKSMKTGNGHESLSALETNEMSLPHPTSAAEKLPLRRSFRTTPSQQLSQEAADGERRLLSSQTTAMLNSKYSQDHGQRSEIIGRKVIKSRNSFLSDSNSSLGEISNSEDDHLKMELPKTKHIDEMSFESKMTTVSPSLQQAQSHASRQYPMKSLALKESERSRVALSYGNGGMVQPNPPLSAGKPLSARRVDSNSADLFAIFKLAYPDYSGDELQFKTLCTRLAHPKPEFSIMKAFYDDFVLRHGSSYRAYCMTCLDRGEAPQEYEGWFEDNVEAVQFRSRVLNKGLLMEYLRSTDPGITKPSQIQLPQAETPTTEDSEIQEMHCFSPATDNVNRNALQHRGRHLQTSSSSQATKLMRGRAEINRNDFASLQKPQQTATRRLPWSSPAEPTKKDSPNFGRSPNAYSDIDPTGLYRRLNASQERRRVSLRDYGSTRKLSREQYKPYPGPSGRQSPTSKRFEPGSATKRLKSVSGTVTTERPDRRISLGTNQLPVQHVEGESEARSGQPKDTSLRANTLAHGGFDPSDPYTPFNTYARASRQLKHGNGNAWAQERGFKSRQVTDI